jgi:lipid-A-disaccharide synthase-like uncharacterized protein
MIEAFGTDLIIGIIGMLCILIAFVVDEFYRKFNPENLGYDALNLFGSGLLIYYAIILGSWPFIILNAVWCIASAIKIIELLKRRKRRKMEFNR